MKYIPISNNLAKKLDTRKMLNTDSYEEVIWDLVEMQPQELLPEEHDNIFIHEEIEWS